MSGKSPKQTPAQNGDYTLGRMFTEIRQEIFSDHILMVASGLAFHAMLAVLPTLAAIAAVWQIIADPAVLERAVDLTEGFLPPALVELARDFITSVPEGFGLGIGLAVNLAFVLWTAQRSASGLISALNIVFDEKESRTRFRRALAGLGIAVGGVGYLLASLATLAILPLVTSHLNAAAFQNLSYLRWPLLALTFYGGVTLLFSFGPCRSNPRWQPFTWGALAATLSWLLISFGLTFYLEYAGSFGRLYGSISSVVIALLWFYLSALSVLMGAEIDVTLEQRNQGRRRSPLKRELRDHEQGP